MTDNPGSTDNGTYPEMDATNDHLVGVQGDRVVIVLPPRGPMDRSEALRLAAWIVALVDPGGDDFLLTLAAVEGT